MSCRRFQVTLSSEEFERLRQLAESERRPVKRQAEAIIVKALERKRPATPIIMEAGRVHLN
jgi:hypothetical protein